MKWLSLCFGFLLLLSAKRVTIFIFLGLIEEACEALDIMYSFAKGRTREKFWTVP
jgi:RsiW-degrading membrane proteinase PrsW (M82 family)